MKIVSAQCPDCGAKIEVDEHSHQTKCDYCHSKIIVRDAIKKYHNEESGPLKIEATLELGRKIEEEKTKLQKEEALKKKIEEQRKLSAKYERRQTVKELIILALVTPVLILLVWGFSIFCSWIAK